MAPGIELPAEKTPAGVALQPGPQRFMDAQPGTAADSARQKVREFIWLSRQRWMTADAASTSFREAMRRDQLFASGGGHQWDTADAQARADQGRPCIEINRIPQFIRQVSNQNRANRSEIKIAARGKGATTDVANALQGLVRGIEVESDADIAYDTATDHQLISGMGFVGLVAKWANDEAFEQVCRIRRVRNPLSVYWDPSTQEADFEDARWMHVIATMGKDEYESRFGKSTSYQVMSEFMGGTQQRMDDWMPEGKVLVAEYYYVTLEPRNLLRMDSGVNIWDTELEHYQHMYWLAHPGEQAQVVRERPVDKRVVRWALHNGVDILLGNKDKTEGRELPGSRIPLFPVVGEERDMDGIIDYRGMVRDARHPQQMYNFWSSSIAEAVALAPKAPWIAAKGQVEQYLDDWKDANRSAKAVLLYDPKAVGDQLVPPPNRTAIGADIAAMVQGLQLTNQDLMSVMGLFEPSLGQRGAASESGKAREALQQQGVIANSNFLDNLQRTKRSVGRALLQWIPVIYDVPRIEHLLQPDGKKKPAVVYAGAENKPKPDEFPKDITEMYDVGVGQFDVAVTTGPSYPTEKAATEAWLLDLFKVLPGLAAIGADIVLDNSDNPAAQQLAKRAKKALPPQFQDESDPDTMLPMLQAKVQQQDQLLEAANKAIASLAKVVTGKELESDTKREVAMIQANAQMSIAQSKIGSAESIAAFQAEASRYAQLVDVIHGQTVSAMESDAAERGDLRQQQASIAQIGAKRDADASLNQQNAELNPQPAPDGKPTSGA